MPATAVDRLTPSACARPAPPGRRTRVDPDFRPAPALPIL